MNEYDRLKKQFDEIKNREKKSALNELLCLLNRHSLDGNGTEYIELHGDGSGSIRQLIGDGDKVVIMWHDLDHLAELVKE